MSPAPRTRRKRRKASLFAWWPLVVAVIATPFAVRGASVLALSGPFALKLLYPFVTLMQAHWTASLAASQRDTLSEWAMWAQFPAYGLVASLIGRALGVWRGLLLVAGLHIAAVGVALLVAR